MFWSDPATNQNPIENLDRTKDQYDGKEAL